MGFVPGLVISLHDVFPSRTHRFLFPISKMGLGVFCSRLGACRVGGFGRRISVGCFLLPVSVFGLGVFCSHLGGVSCHSSHVRAESTVCVSFLDWWLRFREGDFSFREGFGFRRASVPCSCNGVLCSVVFSVPMCRCVAFRQQWYRCLNVGVHFFP